MGVFEEVVVNVKSAVDAVSKKTGELVGVSKLKINEAEINGSIKKIYEKLGELIYENIKSSKSVDDNSEEYIKKIDELKLQLESIKGEISRSESKSECGCCGNKNIKDASFCCKCGKRLD